MRGIVQNVKITIESGQVVIRIDPSKRFGMSSTGKSTIVASTQGFTAVDGVDGVRVNVTAITK